jgi:hypothetical protein
MARSGTGTNRQRKLRRRSSSGSGLVAASLVRKRAHCGQRGPRFSLMATDECEVLGLHSPCGRLVTTSDGLRRQHCLVVSALVACYLDQCGIERSSAQSKLCPNALNHRVVRRYRSVSGLVAASLVRKSDHRGK